jgi:hypothetical protein
LTFTVPTALGAALVTSVIAALSGRPSPQLRDIGAQYTHAITGNCEKSWQTV